MTFLPICINAVINSHVLCKSRFFLGCEGTQRARILLWIVHLFLVLTEIFRLDKAFLRVWEEVGEHLLLLLAPLRYVSEFMDMDK